MDKKCKGKVHCKNYEELPHKCPYAEEISGNNNPEYCTCCKDCRRDCLQSI